MAMRQQSLASQAVFEKYGRKSRRELFLDEMDEVVPWVELQALVEPHYPKAGGGRRPVGVAIMLRVYFMQQWFDLSDPGVEEALYESAVLRRFVGVDLGLRRHRTRRRSAASAICWKSTSWAGRCWMW
jgi:IS5 family transposase